MGYNIIGFKRDQQYLVPLHVFIFSLFPFVFLYSMNIGYLSVGEIVSPAGTTFILTIIILFAGNWIFKSSSKSAYFVSFFLLAFFSYGHIHNIIENYTVFGVNIGRHRYLSIWYALSFAVWLYLFKKNSDQIGEITHILNQVAIVLLLINLVTIVFYQSSNLLSGSNEVNQGGNEIGQAFHLKKPDHLPDIYYIILDGYTDGTALNHYFQFDNKEFFDFLKSRNFNISKHSSILLLPPK